MQEAVELLNKLREKNYQIPHQELFKTVTLNPETAEYLFSELTDEYIAEAKEKVYYLLMNMISMSGKTSFDSLVVNSSKLLESGNISGLGLQILQKVSNFSKLDFPEELTWKIIERCQASELAAVLQLTNLTEEMIDYSVDRYINEVALISSDEWHKWAYLHGFNTTYQAAIKNPALTSESLLKLQMLLFMWSSYDTARHTRSIK